MFQTRPFRHARLHLRPSILPRLADEASKLGQAWHLRLQLANWACGLLPDFVFSQFRSRLYRLIGVQVDRTAFIAGNLMLVGSGERFYQRLQIGPGAVLGNQIIINLDAEVRLGRNVSLGPLVRIYTGTHQVGPGSMRRIPPVLARPVVVEDGAWIGLAAILLPGVTVSRGSVVAAGAVVFEDVPPNSYVEGNPARVVRQLPWGDR